MYLTDNWRAFRTWGVSANSPWEHGIFWTPARRRRQEPQGPARSTGSNLQRPGLQPGLHRRAATSGWTWPSSASDWIPTAAGAGPAPQQPAAAGLHRRQAGRASPARTTTSCRARRSRSSSSSSTTPAQTGDVRLRSGRSACRRPSPGSKQVTVPTGQQERIPLRFALPADAGAGHVRARRDRQVQHRRDAEGLLRRPRAAAPRGRASRRRRSPSSTPRARPASCWQAMGVQLPARRGRRRPVRLRRADRRQGRADRSTGPAPDIGRVRDGLKVIVFEQTVGGAGEAVRLPRRGVRPAAGLPARARPSRSWPASTRRTCATGAARRRSCRRA